MSLTQQFREAFAGTWTWIKREPWMMTIVGPIWLVMHTKEERDVHIRRAMADADCR